MTISKFASKDVVCVSEDGSLVEAAECMKGAKVGAVVVVKDRKSDLTPLGVITDRDLALQLLAADVDPKTVAVKDLLTHDLLVVHDSYSVKKTLQVMKSAGVRRIPIVNDANQVVGIITMDDLLVLMIDELSCLSEVIKQQKN